MFSIAVGSGAVGLLVSQLGYENGLIVAGAAVPILLLLRIGRLFRVDRDAAVPDDRVLEIILGDDIFGSLPAPVIERLAADAEHHHVAAGTAVITEGEHGDRYYVIDSGEAEVSIAGRHVRVIGAGRGFGELALLHDVARTVTVVAANRPLPPRLRPRAVPPGRHRSRPQRGHRPRTSRPPPRPHHLTVAEGVRHLARRSTGMRGVMQGGHPGTNGA